MSKRWTTVAALTAALMVMIRPTLVVGQGTGQPTEIDPEFIPRLLPFTIVGPDASQRPAPPPDFALRVWLGEASTSDKSDAGKEKAALHGQVKDFLNKARLGVPEDRIHFFEPQWENCPPIIGWSGMVYMVKPIQGGYAVTLEVGAAMGGRAGDSLRLYEHYTIVGGKVKYRGYTLPAPGVRVHS